MDNLITFLTGGIRLLPLMGVFAALLIVIQYFNFRKMKNQFSDCIIRNGLIKEMGIREPTKTRPYRHPFVLCSFSNSCDSLEVPYESGDLNNCQAGDEIPLYFYPNGAVTVVAYDDETTRKKFKKQIIIIIILFAVLSFLIPAVGIIVLNRMLK